MECKKNAAERKTPSRALVSERVAAVTVLRNKGLYRA